MLYASQCSCSQVLVFCVLQYDRMSSDIQFQSLAEVDNFAESTNSSLNYLILEALGNGDGIIVLKITINFILSSSLKLNQKHYLPLTFRSLTEIFIRRSWYSVLPRLELFLAEFY